MSFFSLHRDRVMSSLATEPQLSGHALCESFTHAVDTLVLGALKAALDATGLADPTTHGLPAGWALMALGGYGRRQMCLRSDVDLQLIVPPDAGDPTELMRALLAPLMAERLKLGHGVRTVAEALELARSDLSFGTAALTARHLAGDPAITEAVRQPVYQHYAREGFRQLVDWIAADRQARARRHGDTVYVLEPDLKNGVGGLRDAQIAGWLARLTGEPIDLRVLQAEDTLLKVRMALHGVAAFKSDRLTFEYQDEVARRLGLTGGVDEDPAIPLMREVHLASRVLDRHAVRRLTIARDRTEEPTRAALPGRPGFVTVGGRRLARADGAAPHTVEDVVETLRTVVATDLRVEPLLEDGLEAVGRQLGEALAEDEAMQALLLDVLLDPSPGASRALHLMHRTGLLMAIVPELHAIMGRIQRDLYHVYTVDAHSLRAVDRLKAIARGDHAEDLPLATAVMPPEAGRRVLTVATLLHDIGKGYGPQHHYRGALLAGPISARLGLSQRERGLVASLIEHQADLALICMRRDLSDPRPITYVARVVGDLPTLDLLYLLTVADWSSVGPSTFTAWHRDLLDTLYQRTRAFLQDPGLFADPQGVVRARRQHLASAELGAVPQAPDATSDPIDDFCAALPTRYFHATTADQTERHYRLWRRAVQSGQPVVELRPEPGREDAELLVVGDDRPGLLADLTGGLASIGVDVLSADIYSLVGAKVLDVFRLADPHRRLADPDQARRLAERLRTAMLDPQAVRKRLAERSGAHREVGGLPPIETTVTASNEAASHHTVFDVATGDRTGLLHRIAAFFRDRDLSVDQAYVATEGRIARDSFYVVTDRGAKLDRELAEATAAELARVLEA